MSTTTTFTAQETPVAGSSRAVGDASPRRKDATVMVSDHLALDHRQRLLKSNKKLEHVLGAHFPSSFLQLTDLPDRTSVILQPVGIQKRRRDGHARLRKPSSSGLSTKETVEMQDRQRAAIARRKRVPPIILPPYPDNSGNSTALPKRLSCDEDIGSPPCVRPLALRPRVRRKSLSVATVQMSEADRDAILSQHISQADPGASLSRSSSQKTTRSFRPLPPVPGSRSSSFSSSGCSAHCPIRPLPVPPIPPLPDAINQQVVPEDVESSYPEVLTEQSPISSPLTMEHALGCAIESEPSSPITPKTSTSEISFQFPGVFNYHKQRPPTSRSSLYQQPQHSRSATSLSSLGSLVPPVPTPADIRRQQLNKMAKLIRVLGESPPRHLVFGSGYASGLNAPLQRVQTRIEPAVVEEVVFDRSSITFLSNEQDHEDEDEEEQRDVIEEIFARSEPGHDVEYIKPASTIDLTSPPSITANIRPLARLRSRSKRDGISFARRAVSLNVDAIAPGVDFAKPAGGKLTRSSSARRKSLKLEPIYAEVPPLPLQQTDGAALWMRKVGRTRWEVEDYVNIVHALREL